MFVSDFVTSLFVYFFYDVRERCQGHCKPSADISQLSDTKFHLSSSISRSKLIQILEQLYSHFLDSFFYRFMYNVRYFLLFVRRMQCFKATA